MFVQLQQGTKYTFMYKPQCSTYCHCYYSWLMYSSVAHIHILIQRLPSCSYFRTYFKFVANSPTHLPEPIFYSNCHQRYHCPSICYIICVVLSTLRTIKQYTAGSYTNVGYYQSGNLWTLIEIDADFKVYITVTHILLWS